MIMVKNFWVLLKRKNILFLALLATKNVWSAGTSALAASSSSSTSSMLTNVIIVSSIVGSVSAILAVGTGLMQFKAMNTSFGQNSKNAIDKANKYAEKLNEIAIQLPGEYDKLAQLNNDRAKIEANLLNFNTQMTDKETDTEEEKDAIAKQEKELLQNLKTIKKKQTKQQKIILDLLRTDQLYRAYIASIEKQYGGNLDQNFLQQEAAKQVEAAKQKLGLGNVTTFTQSKPGK